jgi:hypothetical protein
MGFNRSQFNFFTKPKLKSLLGTVQPVALLLFVRLSLAQFSLHSTNDDVAMNYKERVQKAKTEAPNTGAAKRYFDRLNKVLLRYQQSSPTTTTTIVVQKPQTQVLDSQLPLRLRQPPGSKRVRFQL